MMRVSPRASPSSPTSPPTPTRPTSGPSAFAHKAGLHASAIKVDPELYNHLDPARRRQRHADPGHRDGRPGLGRAQGPRARASTWPASRTRSAGSSTQVKELEAAGWSFEAADASFELLLRAELPDARRRRRSRWSRYRVIVEHREDGAVVSEATVKVHVDGERIIATAEGNGPVNALDNALRRRWSPALPGAGRVSSWPTTRCASWRAGTAPSAITRVLVDTDRRRRREWTTVGVHDNVVEASWHALVDALTYAVLRSPTDGADVSFRAARSRPSVRQPRDVGDVDVHDDLRLRGRPRSTAPAVDEVARQRAADQPYVRGVSADGFEVAGSPRTQTKVSGLPRGSTTTRQHRLPSSESTARA